MYHRVAQDPPLEKVSKQNMKEVCNTINVIATRCQTLTDHLPIKQYLQKQRNRVSTAMLYTLKNAEAMMYVPITMICKNKTQKSRQRNDDNEIVIVSLKLNK